MGKLNRWHCSIFCFALTAGFFAGRQTQTPVAPTLTLPTSYAALSNSKLAVASNPSYSPSQLEQNLQSENALVRLDTLFYIWKNSLTQSMKPFLVHLTESDPNEQVKALSSWMLNPQMSPIRAGINHSANNDEIAQEASLLTEMVADDNTVMQANERLELDVDLIEPIYTMSPERQLKYVQTLVQSNEDSAVSALNDLILYDEPTVQNAAIEGLIAILEQDTGHFPTILNMLEQNDAFLDDAQRAKILHINQMRLAHQSQ